MCPSTHVPTGKNPKQQSFYNVDEMEMDFSLNKKVFIEIGIKNDTDEYPE